MTQIKSVRNFLHLVFQNGFIPTINKPTRITKNSATSMDQIITNKFTDTKVKTGIFISDISDHFSIFIATQNYNLSKNSQKVKITKRIINDVSVELFNQPLSSVNWENILQIKSTNKTYDNFLQIFQKHYNNAFPEITKVIKPKMYLNPRITTGILKSSKKKQRLYENFCKKRTIDNKSKYKKYKGIFELVINRSKQCIIQINY
ncbi:glutamate racemase-like [Hydra vulgaris]|uniref:glutamate racemase-like n=1 Tax=Hydra vulgaris TaxID=6087 RepID=UPI0032EA5841